MQVYAHTLQEVTYICLNRMVLSRSPTIERHVVLHCVVRPTWGGLRKRRPHRKT
jgi:hypothetical protein